MNFHYFKSLRKNDLIICGLLFLLYTPINFYYSITEKIDSINFTFRILCFLCLFIYLKFESFLQNKDNLILKPLMLFFKYLLYICLYLSLLSEALPLLRKNLCSKKIKITSYLSGSLLESKCSFSPKTKNLF